MLRFVTAYIVVNDLNNKTIYKILRYWSILFLEISIIDTNLLME